MLTISPTNFKADTKPVPSTFNTNSYKSYPALIPYEDDLVDLQALDMSKNLQKKQKKQERLQKLGVYSSCGIAVALLGTFALMLIGQFKGKGEKAKIVWEDIAKKQNFPELDDPCVNVKVRKFIKTVKQTSGLREEICKRAGVDMPEQCIIIWGPSGTGKTFSAKMLAKELGAEYSEVQFADVSSPYIGQTSVEIQNVFKKLAAQAKKNPNKKFLVAFNEIDALLVPREKCGSNNLHLAENRTAFLNGLDQIKQLSNLKIVGTTNVNPDSGNLDKASLSRFGNILKIDLPDKNEIIASLKFHLSKSEDVKSGKFFEKNKSNIENFAKDLVSKKYAHRDIEDIARKARTSYAFDLQDGKTNEFDLKYLKEAVETKGKPVGAIGEPIPIFERTDLEEPEFLNMDYKKSKSIFRKWFSKNNN